MEQELSKPVCSLLQVSIGSVVHRANQPGDILQAVHNQRLPDTQVAFDKQAERNIQAAHMSVYMLAHSWEARQRGWTVEQADQLE
jgi:hypothetical protein